MMRLELQKFKTLNSDAASLNGDVTTPKSINSGAFKFNAIIGITASQKKEAVTEAQHLSDSEEIE
jgi:hypothetical protein